MKGFPNQIAKLPKLAAGMRVLVDLVDNGDNAKNDGIFGEALLRAGVIDKRNKRISIEEYLAEQRRKDLGDQSFRAAARLLREQYELFGFIDDSQAQVVVHDLGRQAAGFAGLPLGQQTSFWRNVVQNTTKAERGGPISHPYQVMLRLVGQRPGIPRAKCALALEANDDSPEELARIVDLTDRTEDQIMQQIGATRRTWDNAKKILPSFAEQLGDVIKKGGGFWLADAPGRKDAGPVEETADQRKVRAPRTSREVTPETIAQAGIGDSTNEFEIPSNIDPTAVKAAIKLRKERLKRHNLIVKELGARFAAAGAALRENPFDLLALIEAIGILVEVKTLDGSAADERERVRDALSQLLYYEAFVTAPEAGEAAIYKVACFEGPISEGHREWLNQSRFAVIWKANGAIAGDDLAGDFLGDYLQELR